MAGEWRDTTLGEVTDFLSGGTPSKGRADYWDGSIPWVSAKDMKRFRLDDSEDHVTEDGASNGTRLAPAGSVLLLVRGMTLLNDLPICVISQPMTFNQDVKALRPNANVTHEFLPYLLLGNKDRLLARVDLAGHGTGRLNSDELKSLGIGLPPLPEQRAIAHILGTLDDKIELNRRRNQTLEAMARALFKDWFVDFGPVRAKMEGRDPYLPPDLWQLFPDSLDNDGKPDGWEVVPASELIEFNPTEPLRKGTPAHYLEMSSLPTSGSWSEPPVMRDYGSGMRFRNGDTLLARITPCLENGKTALVQCLPDDTVGWGSTEYIVMRPKAPVPAEFAYLLARDGTFREHAIRSMTGTSGRQRAQGDSVAAFKLASPAHENVWHVFAMQVAPIFESIKSNAKASETLAQLRGTLLPKLISGALRIADAEKFLSVQSRKHTLNAIWSEYGQS
tara:strand:+ start:346464 stop:347804 length:1341 start_codon:yes stop_codon:yes gene_type:complete